jgi:hypothetical protein
MTNPFFQNVRAKKKVRFCIQILAGGIPWEANRNG